MPPIEKWDSYMKNQHKFEKMEYNCFLMSFSWNKVIWVKKKLITNSLNAPRKKKNVKIGIKKCVEHKQGFDL